ncbi:LOW QUALITY PROTEIN: EF-hand calcium-binding domain-containing protein 9 [Spheniscus humboldti]
MILWTDGHEHHHCVNYDLSESAQSSAARVSRAELLLSITTQGEETADLTVKLKSGCFLQHLHLDEVYCLLSVRNTAALAEYFQLLDVHKNYLNNLQFYCFLRYVTDLNKEQITLLFNLLDQNARGRICFNEFYMVACILLSREVCTLQVLELNHFEKQFIHQHTGPAFQLLDVDGDNMIDFNEFEATRFLFNIKKELKKIFKDFDISGDEQRNYREFKMFAVFCIDKQQKEEGDHE